MPDARDVGVDRHVAQPEGEQQHAGRGLAAHAGQRDEVVARLGAPAASRSHASVGSGPASAAQDLLDARGLRPCEMPPGRIASSTSSTGASRTASQRREALAQAQVGDVAVAVVGRLREHGEDELVERVGRAGAPRGGRRASQPLAQRAHAAGLGRIPFRARHGGDLGAHRDQPMVDELQEGAAPFETLECRAARDRDRRRARARDVRWGNRGAPTGVEPSGVSNAYSAARLRCRFLLLRRACLAPGRRTRQERRAGWDRAQGRQAGQPHPRASRAAQAEGSRPLAARRQRPHRRHAPGATSSATLERRHADGDPRPPLHRDARWVGENIALTSRRRGVARKVVRMWMASPPHRAVLLSPSGRRIGVGKRRASSWAARRAVFTADLASSVLTPGTAAVPDSLRRHR